jgi:hypothetical protein
MRTARLKGAPVEKLEEPITGPDHTDVEAGANG